MKPIWKERNKNGYSELISSLPVSEAVKKVLETIPFDCEDDIFSFLEYSDEFLDIIAYENINDEAIEMIIEAIESGKRIRIFGDYDVDGITSTVVLYSYLKKTGVSVDYFVPSRHDEGYGLNFESIESMGLDFDLLVTVDCGITSITEVSNLKERGKEVIITDHHKPHQKLPDTSIINPQLHNGYKNLAGVGTVLSLVANLDGVLNIGIDNDIFAFAAIGTIADVMPITSHNRNLVIRGFQAFESLKNAGLLELIKVCGLDENNISLYDIAFRLAPKINAAGRLQHAQLALKLFLEGEIENASVLFELNSERQRMEQEILQLAVETVDESQDVIIAHGNDWNDGVIGIVASRLAEKFGKSSVVLNISGDIVKGSARSYANVDIFKALSSVSQHFIKFGGHKQAAGLSLKLENLGEFKSDLEKYFKSEVSESDKQSFIEYISEITPSDVTLQAAESISELEPFGNGNPKPLFLLKDVYCDSKSYIGKDKNHLSMKLSKQSRSFDALMFNFKQEMMEREAYDILVNMEINEFKGIRSLKLFIKDFRLSDSSGKIDVAADVINIESLAAYLLGIGKIKGTPEQFCRKFEVTPTDLKFSLNMLKYFKFIDYIYRDNHFLIVYNQNVGKFDAANKEYHKYILERKYNHGFKKQD